jgi:hypothetical protein
MLQKDSHFNEQHLAMVVNRRGYMVIGCSALFPKGTHIPPEKLDIDQPVTIISRTDEFDYLEQARLLKEIGAVAPHQKPSNWPFFYRVMTD